MDIPEHPTLIRRMLDARLKQVATAKPVLAASLVEIAKHCGRKGCHCQQGGPKHVGHYLTSKVQGKTPRSTSPSTSSTTCVHGSKNTNA